MLQFTVLIGYNMIYKVVSYVLSLHFSLNLQFLYFQATRQAPSAVGAESTSETTPRPRERSSAWWRGPASTYLKACRPPGTSLRPAGWPTSGCSTPPPRTAASPYSWHGPRPAGTSTRGKVSVELNTVELTLH